jgi:hypothetical protein
MADNNWQRAVNFIGAHQASSDEDAIKALERLLDEAEERGAGDDVPWIKIEPGGPMPNPKGQTVEVWSNGHVSTRTYATIDGRSGFLEQDEWSGWIGGTPGSHWRAHNPRPRKGPNA